MTKKICHLLVKYGSENQRYTSELLNVMCQNSKDEHFIYCHEKAKKSDKIKVVVSVKQSKFKSLFKFLKFIAFDLEFRKLYKKISKREIYKWIWLIAYKIDVMHIHHEHAISNEIIEYLKSKNVKIIISLRGKDLLINKNKNLHKKLLEADIIHTISYFMQNELNFKYGLDSIVIYRGLKSPNPSNIKKKNFQENCIKLICVGRLVWEKGHIYLIESVNRLIIEGHHVELDIFGEGELFEFLNFRINQLRLNGVINLKGFVNNNKLKEIYKNYDVAVQPSISEALSNGLIDLMSHNIPCVISNVGGMPEIIENDKNGIVFDIQDVLSLDNAILEAGNINWEELQNLNTTKRRVFSFEEELTGLLDLYA